MRFIQTVGAVLVLVVLSACSPSSNPLSGVTDMIGGLRGCEAEVVSLGIDPTRYKAETFQQTTNGQVVGQFYGVVLDNMIVWNRDASFLNTPDFDFENEEGLQDWNFEDLIVFDPKVPATGGDSRPAIRISFSDNCGG